MADILNTPQVQIIVLMAIAMVLVLVGARVVTRFRDHATDDEPTPTDDLLNFREMHSQGVLSDEEFRTIKTVLATKLRDELNDADGKG